MKWEITTPPASTPVSYADAKAHCRIDADDERDWFLTAIATATEYAEQATNRSFVPRQMKLTTYDNERCPPEGMLYLPRGVVTSIVSVTDANGTVLDPGRYQLRRVGTRDAMYMLGTPWPLAVVYNAGELPVPARIRMGILLHVAHLWENRSASTTRPQTYAAFGLENLYGQLASGGIL